MILFIWPQELFILCSGEVTLSTCHFIALEIVLTRVVAILGSCSISVFVCPFVALVHVSVGLAECIEPGVSLAPHLCAVAPYKFLSSFNSIRDR
jgi:hypothetical protein